MWEIPPEEGGLGVFSRGELTKSAHDHPKRTRKERKKGQHFFWVFGPSQKKRGKLGSGGKTPPGFRDEKKRGTEIS